MKQQFRLISALIIAGFTIISQSSCKEHTLIDAKVAPTIDNIHVFQTDTFTVLTKTISDDTLVTSNSISGVPVYHGLGAIVGGNTTFGNTTEGIYLQVIPEVLSPSFLTTDVVDSATLILPYGNYSFGNTTMAGTQSFNVYPVTDSGFSILNGYTSLTSVSYDPSTIYGSATNVDMQKLMTDSPIVDGIKREPMLRIKLANNTAALFTALTKANQQSDIPSFLKTFSGVYIRNADTSAGSLIPYFQLDGVDTYSRAGILVYHHSPSTTGEQIFQYYFDIQTCAHYNRITRNYSGSYAQSLLASHTRSDSIALIQNLPGMAIDVQIPFLNNAFDQSKSKFIINSAQLIITQISTGPLANPIFGPLVKMTVTGVGGSDPLSDSLYVISDSYPLTSPYAALFIDGNAKQVTVGGVTTNQYTLNLPREVMEAIAQKRAVHVRLNGTIDYPGSMQTVVGGGANTNPNYRMKLNIVYTKI